MVKGMKNRKNRTEVLRNFQGEKVIIAGKKDPIIPFKQIESVAEKTNCALKVLPDGHMGFLENKDKLKTILEKIYL